MIHHALQSFRIKNRKEWFYFKNNLELAYAIKTIKEILNYITMFDIQNLNEFKEKTKDISISKELIDTTTINKLQQEECIKAQKHTETIREININNIQKSGTQTGIFKGVCWVSEKNQWKAQLQNNYENVFLGYFIDEIDGAKAYNDYAMYLNHNENTNYLLNEIPGYITVPRNIPKLNKLNINAKKTSKYNGVSYDSKRKCYVTSIKLAGKTYNLGLNNNEEECAKLYNQQALYFNNELMTNYILNDIPNYVTIAKDIKAEIQQKKQNNKTSVYYGVSLTKQGKWVSNYMLNKKKVHIGTFNTELEAVYAYNNTVIILNQNGCKYPVNEIIL